MNPRTPVVEKSQDDKYGEGFYENIKEGSLRSARRVVPAILGAVQAHSVVDIGCGSGTWLRVFIENGIDNVLGLDGGRPKNLEIPAARFQQIDLASSFRLNRKFDLAICMEVAEHLPERRAEEFVRDVVDLAPAVVFSAAIPGQGGTHHVNEQWPDYWAHKFARCGYVAHDCIRPIIWNDDGIEWWYRQNSILYLKEGLAHRKALSSSESLPLRLVHPEMINNPRTLLRGLKNSLLGAWLKPKN